MSSEKKDLQNYAKFHYQYTLIMTRSRWSSNISDLEWCFFLKEAWMAFEWVTFKIWPITTPLCQSTPQLGGWFPWLLFTQRNVQLWYDNLIIKWHYLIINIIHFFYFFLSFVKTCGHFGSSTAQCVSVPCVAPHRYLYLGTFCIENVHRRIAFSFLFHTKKII